MKLTNKIFSLSNLPQCHHTTCIKTIQLHKSNPLPIFHSGSKIYIMPQQINSHNCQSIFCIKSNLPTSFLLHVRNIPQLICVHVYQGNNIFQLFSCYSLKSDQCSKTNIHVYTHLSNVCTRDPGMKHTTYFHMANKLYMYMFFMFYLNTQFQ